MVILSQRNLNEAYTMLQRLFAPSRLSSYNRDLVWPDVNVS